MHFAITLTRCHIRGYTRQYRKVQSLGSRLIPRTTHCVGSSVRLAWPFIGDFYSLRRSALVCVKFSCGTESVHRDNLCYVVLNDLMLYH